MKFCRAFLYKIISNILNTSEPTRDTFLRTKCVDLYDIKKPPLGGFLISKFVNLVIDIC